jgi:hypothetical protein
VAGHHRKLAAEKAGLTAVPCWVEEMDDETAFLELVKSNRQSELSGLEHGMHALRATERGSRTGNSIKDYAESIGRHPRLVNREVAAARVAASWTISSTDLDKVNHLAERSCRVSGWSVWAG